VTDVPMMELTDEAFRAIADLMYASVGLSFAQHKKQLVALRLAHRLARLGLRDYGDYLALLQNPVDGGEFQVAVDLLTTNETYFFRESAHFALMERELARTRPAPLRVWSAASSFGDEAFTAAMVIADMQQAGRIGEDWSVLGTDISDRVLCSAREGVFPNERLREVSPERLRRHFERGEGSAEGLSRVRAHLRERVRFGWLNLCMPIEDIGPFDIVFLRNVLIYFDQPTKAQVVERVVSQLRPGGLLFVGLAEGRVPGVTSLSSIAPGAWRKAAP